MSCCMHAPAYGSVSHRVAWSALCVVPHSYGYVVEKGAAAPTCVVMNVEPTGAPIDAALDTTRSGWPMSDALVFGEVLEVLESPKPPIRASAIPRSRHRRKTPAYAQRSYETGPKVRSYYVSAVQ